MKREPRKLKREWGSPFERERHRRIKAAVAAYAYEVKDNPIMSDAKYDRLALEINVRKSTGNEFMDKWFRDNFDPSTGMWVRNHPDRKGLNRIYKMLKRRR